MSFRLVPKSVTLNDLEKRNGATRVISADLAELFVPHCIEDDEIRPYFHYPAKSASGRIECFTPDRIGVNYCVNVSQTIYRCMQPAVACLTDVVGAGASRSMIMIRT